MPITGFKRQILEVLDADPPPPPNLGISPKNGFFWRFPVYDPVSPTAWNIQILQNEMKSKYYDICATRLKLSKIGIDSRVSTS